MTYVFASKKLLAKNKTSHNLGLHYYMQLSFSVSCFAVLNIIYTFFALKWTPLLNIICSIAIAALALFLAVQFANLHLLAKYDPYLVKTAIFTNAILSILFWEIVYQVKIRKS